MITVHQVCGPRWSTRRRHQSVEAMLLDDGVDAFLARQAQVVLQRIAIFLLSQWSLLFSFFKELLAEPWHFAIPVLLIESNEIFESAVRNTRTVCQIFLEVGFELVEQNLELRIVVLARRVHVRGIHEGCAES